MGEAVRGKRGLWDRADDVCLVSRAEARGLLLTAKFPFSGLGWDKSGLGPRAGRPGLPAGAGAGGAWALAAVGLQRVLGRVGQLRGYPSVPGPHRALAELE